MGLFGIVHPNGYVPDGPGCEDNPPKGGSGVYSALTEGRMKGNTKRHDVPCVKPSAPPPRPAPLLYRCRCGR